MSFVGVGALCPAFIVSGGVGFSVVRVVVSGLRCGAFVGVSRGFYSWVYVLYGFTVSGACGGVLCGVGVCPRGD